MKTKKIAYLGLLVALAFVFSYIEFLLPISLGIPGVKLGFANLVIMVTLYTLGEKDAFLLSVVRILLVGFTFANTASMLYSLAGGVLSFAAMYVAKRIKKFSMAGVSMLGGVFHNVGQILLAMWMLDTDSLMYYLPVLIVTGIVSGVMIGIIGAMITKRLKKLVRV